MKIEERFDYIHNLRNLSEQQMSLAVASRTYAPDWANELLHLFDISKYFDHFEIYPGSKLNHFRALHTKPGYPTGR